MPDEKPKNGNRWLLIGLPLMSAVFAVLGTVYLVGQRTNKIAEVVEWKNDTAPRIERMDSKGTVSFELFHIQYDKEQAQQYERIKDLEHALYDKRIEDLKLRLETLERKQ